MTTWTYTITKTTEATEAVTTYGRGGWDKDTAVDRLNATIRRTDKQDGVIAWGAIVPDNEVPATA
jgi:hypothetical protein